MTRRVDLLVLAAIVLALIAGIALVLGWVDVKTGLALDSFALAAWFASVFRP